MAMAVMKNGWPNLPPPVGTGRKGKRSNKGDLKRITKQSVQEQIKALPKSGGVVTDLVAAQAAVARTIPLKLANQEVDETPFEPAHVAHASNGEPPPPQGDTEWYPTWQFDKDEPAWFNLIRNAYIMKPLGRKFKPDPAYSGKGECPLPQRTALHCEIRWNNVVSFEDALEEARSEAFLKNDNSMRSRGGDALTPVTRDYPGYESSGQPKILEPPAPSPAIQQVPAANQEAHLSSEEMGYKDSTSSGDTDDLRDIHLQSLWYLPVNVAMTLNKDGFAALSNDYWCWIRGDDVCVGKLVSEVYSVEARMPEMDFLYYLETGCDYLLPQDMMSPTLLSNAAVEVLFEDVMPKITTNEFLTWSTTDLDRFHLMVETSRRNFAATDPMKPSFFNDEPTIWEIEEWDDQYIDGLSSLGVSPMERADARQRIIREHAEAQAELDRVAAKEKPVDREEIDFSLLRNKLRMTEDSGLRYHKWLQENQETAPPDVRRQQAFISHAVDGFNREMEKVYTVKALHQKLVGLSCITSTPWLEETQLPKAAPKPSGKMARKAKRHWKRAARWLNTPVLTINGGEGKASPAPEVTDEKVIAASKEIANRIILESLVSKDNREAIEWLQRPGQPLRESHFTEDVMYAIQDEEEHELYSPAGIILGKKSRLEQVNSGGNILLLNAKAPPKTA